MENNEFKKVRIKSRTCFYFDDIIKLEDFDLDNILIDEKSNENILIYDIKIFRYLISLKISITYIFFHYFAKIKGASYDSSPIEKDRIYVML